MVPCVSQSYYLWFSELDDLYEQKRQIMAEFKRQERGWFDVREEFRKRKQEELRRKQVEERRAQQEAYQKDLWVDLKTWWWIPYYHIPPNLRHSLIKAEQIWNNHSFPYLRHSRKWNITHIFTAI